MSKQVQVEYFALLREQRGLARESVSTQAASAGELYAELAARHRFTLPADRLRVAIDGEFAPWSTALKEGALLVFIPPVAGG
jgi:molybdopterin converting factor small subunit